MASSDDTEIHDANTLIREAATTRQPDWLREARVQNEEERAAGGKKEGGAVKKRNKRKRKQKQRSTSSSDLSPQTSGGGSVEESESESAAAAAKPMTLTQIKSQVKLLQETRRTYVSHKVFRQAMKLSGISFKRVADIDALYGYLIKGSCKRPHSFYFEASKELDELGRLVRSNKRGKRRAAKKSKKHAAEGQN